MTQRCRNASNGGSLGPPQLCTGQRCPATPGKTSTTIDWSSTEQLRMALDIWGKRGDAIETAITSRSATAEDQEESRATAQITRDPSNSFVVVEQMTPSIRGPHGAGGVNVVPCSSGRLSS
ncbi:unnamed protein product [Prorocentrum cordatum]|uniref:Uncharacterized protein n=1 Tax=Prorocentrum cordatum TaxID=2364126 RepID=A0ABN9W3X9_9DINO|nr:unnamed protein product [Polarella glacialis]|mmetsp:Transcript_36421/g.95103  ORF Transcript_36421/g.95103 Transcript_36421/m.95103 type:complete len:121 (+) Transcript_36421:202-564(+)